MGAALATMASEGVAKFAESADKKAANTEARLQNLEHMIEGALNTCKTRLYDDMKAHFAIAELTSVEFDEKFDVFFEESSPPTKLTDAVSDVVAVACDSKEDKSRNAALGKSIMSIVKSVLPQTGGGLKKEYGYKVVATNTGSLFRVEYAVVGYKCTAQGIFGSDTLKGFGFYWRRTLLDPIKSDPQIYLAYMEDPEQFNSVLLRLHAQAKLVMGAKFITSIQNMTDVEMAAGQLGKLEESGILPTKNYYDANDQESEHEANENTEANEYTDVPRAQTPDN